MSSIKLITTGIMQKSSRLITKGELLKYTFQAYLINTTQCCSKTQTECKNNVKITQTKFSIGRKGMEFKMNNRLDIYDVKDKMWKEVIIVELKTHKNAAIKIHYKGYTSKSDEWIDIVKENARIAEVGSYSGGEGWAKYSQRRQQELKEKEEEVKQSLKQYQPYKVVDSAGWGVQSSLKLQPEFDYNQIDWQIEEVKFKKELSSKNLRIVEMGRDGNCLFRAIAH